MKNDITSQVKAYGRVRHRRHTWHRVVTTLGCLVVFVTTYALILPAITLESTPDTYCGSQEHVHGDECYTQPGTPARRVIECSVINRVHVHGDGCYDGAGSLVCTLPEGSIHQHTDDCYDENGSLACTQEDYLVHQHDSFCFNDSGELICPLPEQEEHTHEDGCYDESGRLICGKANPLRHQHTGECLTEIPAVEPQGLICTLTEHVHTEDCLDPEKWGETTESDSTADSDLSQTLQGKGLSELTQEELSRLKTFALSDMTQEEIDQLSEEELSRLLEEALVFLGGVSEQETAKTRLDKTLLEMTGAELASLTDEEVTERTGEFLALTEGELNTLNQRMADAAYEPPDVIQTESQLMLLDLAGEEAVLTSVSGTVSITDDVLNSGCYVASYDGSSSGTVTFKWYRTDSGGTETALARKYYTVGGVVTSNISGDSLNSLNLALDSGGITSSRSSVSYRVVLCVDGEETDIEATITNTTHQSEVLNGSFETPVATTGYQPFIKSGQDGIVWNTSASDSQIELVSVANSSYKSNAETWHGITTVPDGNQCAELNAEETGALYQQVVTTPGLTMSWQVDHMARTRSGDTRYDGTDSMYVVIMDASKAHALASDTAQILKVAQAIAGGQYVVDGVDYTGAYSQLCESKSEWTRTNTGNWWRPNYTYSNSCTWQTHSGTYTIPAGQYNTTFFFVAASTASDDETIGNHIDNVWFSTEAAPPAPTDAKLSISKHLYGDLEETALNALLTNMKFNLIDNSSGTILRTVNAYELGQWSQTAAGHWELGKTISISDLVDKTIRIEEAGYTLEGYDITAASTTDTVFTIAAHQSYAVSFTNTYVVPAYTLTLTKYVSGTDTSGTFQIAVSYQSGEEQAVERTYSLGNGQSGKLLKIPAGARVTVMEPSHDGYTVCVKNKDGTLLSDSDYYSFSMEEDTELYIYNTAGVALPVTGGPSIYLFIYGGLFLMLFAVVTGYILRRRWGKEGSG